MTNQIPASAIKIWLITGASSGLGQEMALAALRAGHRVIGTGRNLLKATSSNPALERLGGRWVQLDVTDHQTQKIIEQAMVEEEANIPDQTLVHWVVVNNAGFDLLGAAEDMSESQIVDYFQANVFGSIRVWKATLPVLRRHRTGTVITMSSFFGIVEKAEQMMYSAAKATLDSLTESYASLLAPWGIRVVTVHPGGFRTPFAANRWISDGGVSPDYQNIIQPWINMVESFGKDNSALLGDPDLFGIAVVELIDAKGQFKDIWMEHDMNKSLHIALGSDGYAAIRDKIRSLDLSFARVAGVANVTDVQQ